MPPQAMYEEQRNVRSVMSIQHGGEGIILYIYPKDQ